jgi:N-acetylmuramic acid 6-phosphate etherase
MADLVTTEAIDPRFEALDTYSYAESLKAIVTSHQRAVEALYPALGMLERAAEAVAERLAAGGRLVYLGAGSSGRLAVQDAVELLPTFDFDRIVTLLAGGEAANLHSAEGAEDDEEAARQAVDAAEVGPADALIGLAASGRTPYTVAGVKRARERGALTVGIANNASTPLLEAAEIGILLETGPEVLAGSTRMAAGTAQKVALNALSTSVLVRLGGAYKNLMVGMRPSNAKLRRRAVAIVAAATGKPDEEAKRALERCDWKMREAIVTLETGLAPTKASELLERHRQRVRDVLATLRQEAP